MHNLTIICNKSTSVVHAVELLNVIFLSRYYVFAILSKQDFEVYNLYINHLHSIVLSVSKDTPLSIL